MTPGDFKTWKTCFIAELLQPGDDARFLDAWERDLQPFRVEWCADALAYLRANVGRFGSQPSKRFLSHVLAYLHARTTAERQQAQTKKYTRMQTDRAPSIDGWSYAEAARRVPEAAGVRPAAEVLEEYRRELLAAAAKPTARPARRAKSSPAPAAAGAAIAGIIGISAEPAAYASRHRART